MKLKNKPSRISKAGVLAAIFWSSAGHVEHMIILDITQRFVAFFANPNFANSRPITLSILIIFSFSFLFLCITLPPTVSKPLLNHHTISVAEIKTSFR